MVIGGAAIDLAMGLTPYEWLINNYAMSIGSGRMLAIGGVSHSTYLFIDCGGSGIWRVCLYTRPGGCTPNAGSAPLEHQAFLLRQDM